jgi:hypothetical protein
MGGAVYILSYYLQVTQPHMLRIPTFKPNWGEGGVYRMKYTTFLKGKLCGKREQLIQEKLHNILKNRPNLLAVYELG